MNTLNPTSTHLTIPSLNPHRPSLHKPLSFKTHFPKLSYSPIKSSSQNPQNPNFKLKAQTSNSTPQLFRIPFSTPVKATLLTAITATALIFSKFIFNVKPSFAMPAPSNVENLDTDTITDEEKERVLEEQLVSNPNDPELLKSLMEVKIKSKKVPEAIKILDRLIEVEKDDVEWPMMKAHLYAYNGEFELAKNGFNELLKKDPFLVEAYHGLVTVVSQEESGEELRVVEKRVEEAVELCKKENKSSDVRDFRLLSAQIRVLEGRYDEALSVYQDLVKEEPRDFRPYLCQGIIYTLLRKNVEAEKSFEKYRRLVPKGHPYARYFDDNMMATKVFAQRMENERAMAKSER